MGMDLTNTGTAISTYVENIEQEATKSGISEWKPFISPKKFMEVVKPLLNKKQQETVDFLVKNEYGDGKKGKEGVWYWIQPTGIGKMEEFIHLFMYSILYYTFEGKKKFCGYYNSHRISLTMLNCQRMLNRVASKDDNTPIAPTLQDYFDLLNNGAELSDEDRNILLEFKNDWYKHNKSSDGNSLCIDPKELMVVNVNSGSYAFLKDNNPQLNVYGYKNLIKEEDGVIDIIKRYKDKHILFIGCYQSSETFLEFVKKNNINNEKIFDVMMNDEFHEIHSLEENVYRAHFELKNYCKRVYYTSATDLECIPKIKQRKNTNYSVNDLPEEDQNMFTFYEQNKDQFGERYEPACCSKQAAMSSGYITPIKVINWTIMHNKKPKIWSALMDPSIDYVKHERAEFLIKYLFKAFIASRDEFESKGIKVQLFGMLPLNSIILEHIRQSMSYANLVEQNDIWTYMIDSINKGWIITPKGDIIHVEDIEDFLSILNNNKSAFNSKHSEYKDLCCDPSHHNFILNLNMLNTGIDLPNINTVVIGRVIGSRENFAILDQCIGRGLRLLPEDRQKGYMDNPDMSPINKPEKYIKPYCIVHFLTNFLLEENDDKKCRDYYNDVILSLCKSTTVVSFKWFEIDENGQRPSVKRDATKIFKNENEKDKVDNYSYNNEIVEYFSNLNKSYDTLKEAIITIFRECSEGMIFIERNIEDMKRFDKFQDEYNTIISSKEDEPTKRNLLNGLLTEIQNYVNDNNLK